MTAPQPQEDGALKPALTALEDAVHFLTGTQTARIEGRTVYGESRYMQLFDAVSGEATNGGGAGTGSKSRPPFWSDAFDLKHEIDTAVECWQPAFNGVPPTVGRLNHIMVRKWRPQDCRQIEQITVAVQAWGAQVDDLLNPKAKWTLPYPCPNCTTKTVYRRDSGGELVRQNALMLSADGCTCGKCHAHWPPGKFLFLGRLLDTVPSNVGE